MVAPGLEQGLEELRPVLIAGLGNPGPEYEHTPHNLGFLAVDRFALRNGIRVTRPEAQAFVGLGSYRKRQLIIAKPQTYMNRSGESVKLLLKKYELTMNDLLVVYDELALPWGQLRLLKNGSAGGHNGMKSLIASLGSGEFARLRIGCNPGVGPFAKGAGADYLLSPIRRDYDKGLDSLLDHVAEGIESYTAEGAEKAMTIVNRRARGEKE
jgi:PTH1 family peptidyl-tRNA hydrolase